MKPETYYSNGKLLLTGEYVVLDGALSLAIPTRFGQSLTVESIDARKLIWQSLDELGNVWFENAFNIQDEILNQVQHDNDVSSTLTHILNCARQLNPKFLNEDHGFSVKTRLDFSKDWGLGSSSTLINNIAHWASIDAYQLLELTFGGSGYDIACAQHNYPITYQIKDSNRLVKEASFNPKFKNHLYFVYLNKKQNSRDGIAQYKANTSNMAQAIQDIGNITSKIISCDALDNFEDLISRHETIISNIIKQKPIKEILFSDFSGSVKSLGAWGGDFVLATSRENPSAYFRAKGFHTIIPFEDMILMAR